MFSAEALGASKKYVQESLDGVGALKGAPCTIKSTTPITGGTRVTFGYTSNGGVESEASIDVMNGADGADGQDGADATDAQVAQAVADYMEEHPATVEVSDEQVQEAVEDYLDNNPISADAELTELYEIPYKVEYGNTYAENGGLTPTSKTAYIPYDKLIAVNEGERYQVKGNGGFTLYAFDSEKNLIGSVSAKYTVPSGVAYLGATVWQGLVSHLYKVVQKSSLGDNYRSWIEDMMEKEQYRQHNVVKPKYKTPTKGYVTLMVDDCNREGFGNLVQHYIEADIPLCFAYTGNEGQVIQGCDSTFWGATAVDVTDIIDRALENGGEVLCHHTTQMTQAMLEDFDTCYEHFVKAKASMVARGWDVNGIILAGGQGQVVGSPISDKWVRSNFLYSDIYGESQYTEPYYHYRQNLSNYNSLADVKTAITNAMTNHTWVVLYQHGFDEFSEQNLVDLLAWMNTEGYTTSTYKEVYDDLIAYEYSDIPDPSLYYNKAEIDLMLANISGGTVDGVTLTSISATKTKTTYDVAEAGDWTTSDVVVMATYSDGSTVDVTSSATIDDSNVDLTTADDYTIGISYTYGEQTMTTSIAITVTNEGWSEWVDILMTDSRDQYNIALIDGATTKASTDYILSFEAQVQNLSTSTAVRPSFTMTGSYTSIQTSRYIGAKASDTLTVSGTITASQGKGTVYLMYDDFNQKDSTQPSFRIRVRNLTLTEKVTS